jgi:hypothetical protein
VNGRLRLPSVESMFVWAILLIAIAPAVQPVTDPDFFWHLQVGRWIIEHGAIPHQDLFTYTVSDHLFVAHEWLTEVIMAALVNVAGLTGPSLFFGLVTWLGFLALLKTPRKVSFLVAGLSLAIGIVAGNPIWGPRTQMITFTLLVVLLLALRRYRESGDRRWLYVIPPMFVLWVNLHAGFTIGLVFLYITLAGELLRSWAHRRAAASNQEAEAPVGLRPLVIATAAATLAVAINPNVFGIYLYAAQTQFSTAQQRLIVEWFSPDFHRWELRAFEAMLLLLFVLLTLSRRRPRLTDMLLLLAVMALALQSVRHIALFVAVATPILAEQAQAVLDAYRDRLPRFRLPRPNPVIGALNLVVLVVVGLAVVVGYAIPKAASGFTSSTVTSQYPVAALDTLGNDLPPGHVFNQYGWGGYFVYRVWPRQPVYIYGDAAVMGDPFLTEYQNINVLKPDFLDILNRRGVTWVLYPTDDPVAVVLLQTKEWVPVYRDGVATVLVKRTDATHDYLVRHGYQ